MIKTITYKRILNLGNDESKHLELTYEVDEQDDSLDEISNLMELVECKIREDKTESIREEIQTLLHELRILKKQHRELLNKVDGDADEANIDEGGIF